MSDELEGMLRLYSTSRRGVMDAQRKRVELEGQAKALRAEEERHANLLRSLEPAIRQLPGGPVGIAKVVQELNRTAKEPAEKPPQRSHKAPEEPQAVPESFLHRMLPDKPSDKPKEKKHQG